MKAVSRRGGANVEEDKKLPRMRIILMNEVLWRAFNRTISPLIRKRKTSQLQQANIFITRARQQSNAPNLYKFLYPILIACSIRHSLLVCHRVENKRNMIIQLNDTGRKCL